MMKEQENHMRVEMVKVVEVVSHIRMVLGNHMKKGLEIHRMMVLENHRRLELEQIHMRMGLEQIHMKMVLEQGQNYKMELELVHYRLEVCMKACILVL